MKKKLMILGILGLLLGNISCKKEMKITGVPSPLISIADIKEMFQEAPIVLKAENMLGASSICGIVISDPGNGNAPEGLVIMQGYRRKQLRGIALALGDAAFNFTAGDSLVVKIDGATLERKDGVLQITNLPLESVTRISVNNEQKINLKTTTFTDLTKNMKVYESTLVSLQSAVVEDMPLGLKFAGDVLLSDWANKITMQTNSNASFANNAVPGMGNYIGIASFDSQNNPIYLLRNEDDYEGQSLEPPRPKELYSNFPEGWENHDALPARKSGYAGTSDIFPTGEWMMTNMYTLNSANIVNKNGTYAVMLRNNYAVSLEMNFNLPYGASKLSFYYGAATTSSTDAGLPIIVTVEYSQDSGNTWTALDGNLRVDLQSKKYFQEYTLDITGPVRFRISKDASNARLFIDDIAVYQK